MKKESRVIQVRDINLGKNIKAISKKMKQSDVLTKLQLLEVDISSYSYSKIESGKQNPTVSLLVALTKIFDCDFNAFFDESVL